MKRLMGIFGGSVPVYVGERTNRSLGLISEELTPEMVSDVLMRLALIEDVLGEEYTLYDIREALCEKELRKKRGKK